MFNKFDVLETIDMIEKEHLDIRTVTMGVSLLPCIRSTAEETAQAVYDRVMKSAKDLVKTANELSREYGIPIVNKRVSVTPVSLITAAFPEKSPLVGRALDRAAAELGIDFLGGYSALVHKGTADYEEAFLKTIPEVLATTGRLCSSVNVGSSKSGINMDAVRMMGEIVLETAARTADRDGLGCAKLVVFCNAVEDNPFMAGAFHGVGESDTVINVGVSGPGVVQHALKFIPDADLTDAAELIKRTAFKITRAGQLVAKEAAKRLGARFGIVDLSLAPTPARGDSVAHILEELGLEVGKTAYAIVKSTEMMIAEDKMKISARNQFPGKVVSVEEGAVNGIVKVEIAPEVVVSSTISMNAIKDLDVKEGKNVVAVAKATSVMVGVE